MSKSRKYFSNGMCQSSKCNMMNFKSTTSFFIEEVNGVRCFLFYKTDKNNQICDCSRIGNIFDKLHGRPLTSDIASYLVDAYVELRDRECDIIFCNDGNGDNNVILKMTELTL